VRSEVKYQSHVNMAVTLRAHVITQQERDNIHTWLSEAFDMADDKVRL
jgi:hypothetical protein